MNRIKNYLNLLLLTVALTVSIDTNANETTEGVGLTQKEKTLKRLEDKKTNVYTLEQATNSLEERMVFSIIGREAFIKLSGNNIQVDTSSVIDDQKLAAPFYYAAPYLAPVWSALNWLVFFIFVGFTLFVIYIMKDQLQVQGEIKIGSKLSLSPFAIKTLILFFLLFPIPTGNNGMNFNLINDLAGRAFLASFNYSSTLIEDFVDQQAKRYPSIQMPNISYNDKHIALSMINFALCIKKNDINDYSVNMYKDDNNVVFRTIGQDTECNVNVSFDLDLSAKDKINNDLFLSDYFKNTYKINSKYFIDQDEYTAYDYYKSALIDTYTILFNDTLDKAMKAADFITVPNLKIDPRTARDDLVDSKFHNFFGYVNKSFENNCSKLYGLEKMTEISEFDRIFYIEHTALCLAYEITNSIVYPHSISDPVNYFKDDNYVADYQINLCSQNYNNTDTKINYIGIKGSVSYEECMVQECGSLGQLRSNAYNCSSMITIKQDIERDKKMARLGFIAFPSIIINSFKQLDNDEAKTLYNNIRLASLNETEKMEWLKETQEFRNTSSIEDKKHINDIYNNLNDLDITDAYNQLTHNGETVVDIIVNETSMASNNVFSRIQTCSKSPLSTTNGYSCGTIMQEYNKFGQRLIKTYFLAKTAEIVARSVAYKRKQLQKSITDMDVTKKVQKSVAQRAIKYIVGAAILSQFDLVNNAVSNPNDIPNVDKFENENLNVFSNIVNGKFDIQENNLLTSVIVGYAAAAFFDEMAGGNTSLFNFMKFILNTMVSIAVVMALVIPMILFVFATFSIYKIIVNAIYRINMQGLLTVFANTPEQKFIGREISIIIVEILRLFYQPTIFVLSMILIYTMTNIVVSNLISSIDTTGLFNTDGIMLGDMVGMMIVNVLGMVVYIALLWILTNTMNSLLVNGDNYLDELLLGKDLEEMNKQSANSQVINFAKKSAV